MANVDLVKRKPVTIILSDGKERHLKYTLNALVEIEDKYGTVDAGFELLDKGSIKAARFILWAGLIHEDPELTEIEVGSLMDMAYMQELMQTMSSAMKSDVAAPENGNESSSPVAVVTVEPTVTDPNL